MVEAASGAAAFLEFNPRMDSTAALPYRLGYDYPRIAVELAARRAPAPLTTPYRTGVRYHWLYGDALGWLACRNQGRQSRAELRGWALKILRSGLTSRHHLTWDARDPMPTLHLYTGKLIDAVQRRLPPAR
jgi:predicted NAD/FAD-dependent oxidoreductase